MDKLSDINLVDTVINQLANIPDWVYIVLGVIAFITVISLIKKCIKLAITIAIVVTILVSAGIISKETVKDYGNKAMEYGNKAVEYLDK